MAEDYTPSVSRLLALGELRFGATPDYAGMGFELAHVVELLRMATDEALNMADGASAEVWAPIHAINVLGVLRAESAVPDLIQLLDAGDDYMPEAAMKALGKIGPAALPALAARLQAEGQVGGHELYIPDAIARVGIEHPATRAACVDILARQLYQAAAQHRTLNSGIVMGLADLEAREATPVVYAAFLADLVDISLGGGWHDVRETLGATNEPFTLDELRQRPELEPILAAIGTPRSHSWGEEFFGHGQAASTSEPAFTRNAEPGARKTPDPRRKEKAKRKQAEKSRRQQHKKRKK